MPLGGHLLRSFYTFGKLAQYPYFAMRIFEKKKQLEGSSYIEHSTVF